MSIIRDCPHCGRPVIEGSLFCLDCGAELTPDAPGAISGRPVSLDTRIPAEIDLEKLALGAYVICTEGIDRGLYVALLGESPMVIGRDNVAVSLKDPFVSRRHAQLESRGLAWHISDLASANCTFVNSRAIDEHVLVAGDIIEVGYSAMVFYVQE